MIVFCMQPSIFERLNRSKFRREIKLSSKEKDFVKDKGMEKVASDGYDIIFRSVRKLKDGDGRQTPWHGHPIFVAQHATATCCRKCIHRNG